MTAPLLARLHARSSRLPGLGRFGVALAACGLLLGGAPASGSESAPASPSASGGDRIAWQDWTSDLFERARAEGRYVLLDMEAVWCHWCHVMDQETYSDPKVIEVVREHYIPVRVDQDARPDLSARYDRYGWPATIILGPDGTEIVKRRGFLPAEILHSILEAVIEDPSPVPGIEIVLPGEYAPAGQLGDDVRAELEKEHLELLDTETGGLDTLYRYLPWEAVELVLRRVEQGDERQRPWLRKTLDASRQLLDPAFGGVYQYSVERRWDRPHFEKIMSFQAENLRVYALAYAVMRKPSDLDSARNIVRFVDGFLTSPEGAFYTSMDADVVRGQDSAEYFALGEQERRARGLPRVDTHRYARENGWMIEALATLAEVTGDPAALERARKAARWVIAERSLEGGGFRHDATDEAGPYLGDTLAMGRAFLQLYRVTAGRDWLDRARQAAAFIEASFRRAGAGYVTARSDGSPVEPVPQFEQNVTLARFANLLAHYTGDEELRAMAEHALRFAATPDVYRRRLETAGLLLADAELASDPMHLTVVGSKLDPAASALYQAALRQGAWYKRIEWLDPAEGPLPNPDIQYPERDAAAAYVCSQRACSAPITRPEEIPRFLERMRGASPLGADASAPRS